MSLLIGGAVKFCAAHGLPYLTYGKFSYGNKGEDTLTAFKRYNGFQRVLLPRYFIPLTTAGSIALRLGLHRPLRTRLPRPLTNALLRLRAKYYASRFSTPTDQ